MKPNNQIATTKQLLIAQMKNRRGSSTLILFRNGDNFEAYQEDAKIIAATLKIEPSIEDEMETIRFSASKIEANSNQLIDAGFAVCISEMRDKSGNFIVNISQENYEQDSNDNQ